MAAAIVAAADERRFESVVMYGFKLSRAGIAPAGRTKPDAEDWQRLGDYLAWAEGATPWLIAAWLEYGEANFGEQASQEVADATGFELDTIKQYGWVNKKVKPEDRDPDLSFSHHRAVAELPASTQRRMLRRAKAEGLSVKELQREVRILREPDGKADATCWILVQCRSQRDRERFAKTMEREGRTIKIP